jgi:hypothetical protein
VTFLHLFEFTVIAVAGRLVYVRFRPFRTHGRCQGRGCKRCGGSGEVRRLGARWTARFHQIVLRMIDEWRSQ